MIPKRMELFLRERLPERTWKNRLREEGSLRFMEFGPLDVDRLGRLGIEVDTLGPRLVVCLWDEDSPLEIGGYLVVDNLAMGKPSMGGIRMLPDLTPATIHNLARGMTLKNAAADLPYGGGKAGIVARSDLSPAEHTEVVRRFAHLLAHYKDIYLPGPDVGTNDADMKSIAIENGMDHALSKPAEMGGNRIDELGAAAGGVIIALDELLREMDRLRVLPQFSKLPVVPLPGRLTVLIQGFGAVGANAAFFMREQLPGVKVIGVSDGSGYLYDEKGLPVEQLYHLWKERGAVTRPYALEYLAQPTQNRPSAKYSTQPDDLLRESAFCFIPAAPIDHYLDTEAATHPSMTVNRMGEWWLIVEGANTYSPDPERKAMRARMERAVYRQRGVLIATDYLVNSGGVIFAAQEKLIKTPPHLRIPDEMLGNPPAVEEWLSNHAAELHALAEKRRLAGERHRNEIIRRNVHELIELLLSDSDMLPCEAAERLSVRRIAAHESDRTAAEIMEPVPTILLNSTVQQAAALLVEARCPILAVVSAQGELNGVVTEWDITRATAQGSPDDLPLEQIMTRQVISAAPTDGLLDVVRTLEHYEISAMPVVDGKSVLGMVSSDLLARRSLLRLLQSQ
jgi:glutamate dehydrogenase (NAD(P)+)